ncbi:MAG: L-threonine 3-O-phosphate decarboxylase [Cyanobacteriota bacterium]
MLDRPHHGGNLGWAADIADCPAFSLVDFSASINPLGPPPNVLTAIQTAFSALSHYPDPEYRPLRQAIAAYHNLDVDWVLPGNGSAELLTLAGRTFASLKDTNLVTPAFGDYGRSWCGSGARLNVMPWTVGNPWPWQSLHTEAKENRGLILNNPHNPSGVLLSRQNILKLLPVYRWVLIDEAFMDFLPPSEQQSLIADLPKFSNLIILRSLTKFYSLPGLRIGYALAHPNILNQWQQWRDPWPVNVLAEAAAIASFQSTSFQTETWQWLPQERETLFQQLGHLPGLTPIPSAANFLLVKTAFSATQLQLTLLKTARIVIRDCLSFPELGDRFFRVAVRSRAENQQLVRALQYVLCPKKHP